MAEIVEQQTHRHQMQVGGEQTMSSSTGRNMKSGVIIKGCDCSKRNGLSVDCHCMSRTSAPSSPRHMPSPPPQRANIQQQCPPSPTSPRIMKSCYERQQENAGRMMPPARISEMAQFIPPTDYISPPGATFQNQQTMSPHQLKQMQEMLQNTEPVQQRVTPNINCQMQHMTPFGNVNSTNYATTGCECPPGDGIRMDPGTKICPPMQQAMQTQAQMQNQVQLQNQFQAHNQGQSRGVLPVGHPSYTAPTKSIPNPGTYQHVQPLCQCSGNPNEEIMHASSRPPPCSEHRYDIPCSYCMQQF